MNTKRIIPCLDIDDGRVVKGIKFEGIKEVGDPVELARRYNAGGADEIIFLDIGASAKSRSLLLDTVQKAASEVSIPLCIGGGVRTLDDMQNAMNAGAAKVSVCTSALKRPELLREMAETYGSSCVVLSIDAKRINGDGPLRWHAFSHGGRTDTGLDAIEWASRAAELGVGEILVNSIDADGTGAGYDLELLRRIKNAVNVPVIASGGAGTLDQIAQVLLNTASPEMDSAFSPGKSPGADAALVASLLHFGKSTIEEIKKYVRSKGVCVRL
ncbi:MAG: imidazole glycerol phosphate synthase subunit HisF [Treponema sp.]|jgi:cyclase|nr:imidazole glycerol phosphate synthase subunit HisF [Treponema sp.]